MSAMAMIARCSYRQWRGLDPQLRETVEHMWDRGADGVGGASRHHAATSRCVATLLWVTDVSIPVSQRALVMVKEDLYLP